MIEVDSIITDIERNMDTKLTEKYINLFSNMFSGGFTLKDESGDDLKAFNSIQLKLKKWQQNPKEKTIKSKLEMKSGEIYVASSNNVKNPNNYQDFFEHDENPFDVTNTEVLVKFETNSTDSIPPPPPPPPTSTVHLPAICPINFTGISAVDAVGTVWAEISSLNLKSNQIDILASELKALFGRNERSKKINKDEDNFGILEPNRLRNLEILLFMEELKPYNVDQIIEMIQNFTGPIFENCVLERLVRKVSKDGQCLAFLPTTKESEKLIEFEKDVERSKNVLALGEQFFLKITNQISDRNERLLFAYNMSSFESEHLDIQNQLKYIDEANNAIRNSTKFKFSLRIILDILNTLMPRFGLTKGFKISSFTSSVERVTGMAANPNATQGDEIELQNDTGTTKKSRLQALRRKGNKSTEKKFWQVRLQEYISIYLNRFEVCQGFWDDVQEPCSKAMRIDQSTLDDQTSKWIKDFDVMKEWYQINQSKNNDNFIIKLSLFLKKESEVKNIRKAILDTWEKTENLWKWLGERMEGEPQLIFKYIYDFSKEFERQWKMVQSNWEDSKTLVLRGGIKLERHNPNNNQNGKIRPKKLRRKLKRS